MFGDLVRKIQSYYVPTSRLLAQTAQAKLLAHFLPPGVVLESRQSASGLNYVVCQNKDKDKSKAKDKEKTLLLVHGFGAGLGFFFSNLGHLSGSYDRVVALDLPGMGGSSRGSIDDAPRITTPALLYQAFTGNTSNVDSYAVPRAVSFFVNSLEEFCETEGLPRAGLHVAAHSLGAYLAFEYAKVSKRLDDGGSLILISPCGVPKAPALEKRVPMRDVPYTLSIFHFLWQNNVTPQSILRVAGTRGPGLVSSVLNRRFQQRWGTTELGLISDYLYHISALPADGEYSLNSLLTPIMYTDDATSKIKTSVFAKVSIEETIFSSKTKTQQPLIRVPILILYGDHDWLRFEGVEDFVERCNKDHGLTVEYKLIATAGHHLYLENPQDFHRAIDEFRERFC